MSTAASTPRVHYLNHDFSIRSWMLSIDHKRIAWLYLVTISIFFAIGGLFAMMVRLELLTAQGDLMSADTYNRMFTQHGVVMIFLFLIPATPAVMGNFLLPLMIGTVDVAFPKINLLSYYVFLTGAIILTAAIVTGGVDTGWTFYTPLSSTYSNSAVMLGTFGAFITGFSSILTGVNFLVTVHKMRAPGLNWFKLPLFVWSIYATSLIFVLGTPVVAITLLMLFVERAFGLGIFDPALGGDPILFQHLFWFYSHPAVYIMILPAFGVMSEVITAFSRKRIFGYSFVAFSSVGIAILGFLVWAHHMFTTGMSVYAATVFSAITMLIAVPTAVKVINWTTTMYQGSVSWETPMLYAAGFLGLFLIGGLTGVMLATLGLDVHVHDTYFVVAHFHYVMVGGAIMGFLAAIHFWWPKMTGRMYPAGVSKLSALFIFAGFNLTFFPQFLLGYMGMPRRYHSYPEEFEALNILSSAGSSVLGVGYLLPVIYFGWSLIWGARAPSNPWGAVGLEWQTTSPPPVLNFHQKPVITEAYDYDGDIYRDELERLSRIPEEAPVV